MMSFTVLGKCERGIFIRNRRFTTMIPGNAILQRMSSRGDKVSKGFLLSEVLGEVRVLEGGQFGAKFFAKFGPKFLLKFSGLFCWDSQSNKKNFSKNFSPEIPRLCAANLAKTQGKTSQRGSVGGPPPRTKTQNCRVIPEGLLQIDRSYNFYSGSEKGVFWKRGLFRKVHFLEILEHLENLEI